MPDTIICRCEEVSRWEILAAIADGARSVDDVKRRTRAGMGLCQGQTCTRLVMQILAERLGKPVSSFAHPTARVPVRPILLQDLSEEGPTPSDPADRVSGGSP